MLLSSASRQETWEDSELFQPQPSSDIDALGKKRYVGRWTQANLNTWRMDHRLIDPPSTQSASCHLPNRQEA